MTDVSLSYFLIRRLGRSRPTRPTTCIGFKAYVLHEQLDRPWTYTTRDGVARFLFGWL